MKGIVGCQSRSTWSKQKASTCRAAAASPSPAKRGLVNSMYQSQSDSQKNSRSSRTEAENW